MLYHDHWDDVKSHMTQYWLREPMDRACAAMEVVKPGSGDFWQNHYFDVEKADRLHRLRFENTTVYGEMLTSVFPYFGTAGTAEYTGCKPTYTPRTTWFDPWMMEEEPDAERIGYTCPEAFQKQADAVRRLVELSKNDYLVSVTDNAGILDALAQIRGNERLLEDMFDYPEFVEEGVRKLLPIYKKTQKEFLDIVRENNEGSVVSWMNLWSPNRMSQLQCDLCVMISNTMFNRFVMPELEELCSFLEDPVYHFDGQEQIRHLDSLLSIKNLKAIQWTPVVGQPKTSEFIPVLQKIQKAGKNLVLTVSADEAEKILDGLSCRGLFMNIYGIRSHEEAVRMMKLVEKHSKNR